MATPALMAAGKTPSRTAITSSISRSWRVRASSHWPESAASKTLTTNPGATLAAPQMVPAPPMATAAMSMVSLPVKTRKSGRSRVASSTRSKYSKSRLESLIPTTAPSWARVLSVGGSITTFVF